MTKERLLLIDGHSLAFRAFFAVPAETVVAPNGQHTNAVLGFSNMLRTILEEAKPTYLAVAFDLPGGTFRTAEYSEYKAGRGEIPPEFLGQVEVIQKLLEALNIKYFSVPNFEADDIIATLSKLGSIEGKEVLILSGDRDAIQLVNEDVTLLYPVKGVSVINWITPKTVEEKYLVSPKQYPDIAALSGEKADNLPGVPGVGPKIAAKWLKEFGTLENILNHAHEIPGVRGKALYEHLDDVKRNRKLNNLVCDLELGLDPEEPLENLRIADFDTQLLENFCSEFGFSSLMKKTSITWEKLRSEKASGINSQEEKKNGISVDATIFSDVVVSDDVKTWCQNNKAGYCITPLMEQGIVEVFIFGNNSLLVARITHIEKAEKDMLSAWLENPNHKLCFFDAKFTMHTWNQCGFRVVTNKDDLVLSSYLLDPDLRDKSEENLVIKYLGVSPTNWFESPDWKRMYEDILCISGKTKPFSSSQDLKVSAEDKIDLGAEFELAKNKSLGVIANCEDAYSRLNKEDKSKRAGKKLEKQIATYKTLIACIIAMPHLQLVLQKQLEENQQKELIQNLEIPVLECLFTMEKTGIAVDVEKLECIYGDFSSQADRAQEIAWEAVGSQVNLNSPKQLQTVLFEQIGLPRTRKTARGYSTDAESLLELALHAPYEPFVTNLMAYRDVIKIKQMVETLLGCVKDGRIHTTFEQAVAATGRISSKDPNLQNIPTRTDEGKKIRECFVVGEGYDFLLTADYSQIEMRLMAHISQDESLVAAFRSGEDIHKFVASQVYGIDVEEVTSVQRSHVKQVSYGLAYGLSAYGLSKRIRITVPEANYLMRQYFSRFGKVRKFLEHVVFEASQTGYTETILGRRRYAPGLQSSQRQIREAAQRASLNAPIQGSAADIIKIAMLAVKKELEAHKISSRILLQVHDELVLEVTAKELDLVKEIVSQQMHDVMQLSVPLDVSIGVGESWAQAAH